MFERKGERICVLSPVAVAMLQRRRGSATGPKVFPGLTPERLMNGFLHMVGNRKLSGLSIAALRQAVMAERQELEMIAKTPDRQLSLILTDVRTKEGLLELERRFKAM